MKIRVGVLGLSPTWERRHRPALLSLSDRYEVRAVFSDVAIRAEGVAREFNAARVDGFRALSQREDIDAMLLLAPSWFGCTIPILASCDAGKAVYCATALDIDSQQTQGLKSRVDKSGVAFMAEFPRRQAPATLRLKELIATRLGEPQLVFCHHRLPVGKTAQENTDEHARREMLELVDWCRYIVGREPESVMSVMHQNENDETDYSMLSLDFSAGQSGRGTIAQISCGRYIPAEWSEAASFHPPANLQVRCERGVAFIDLPAKLIWFDEAGRHVESLGSERSVGEQLLTQFYRAVTSLVRKASDLEDAYRALEIMNCARQSFQQQKRIKIVYHNGHA